MKLHPLRLVMEKMVVYTLAIGIKLTVLGSITLYGEIAQAKI